VTPDAAVLLSARVAVVAFSAYLVALLVVRATAQVVRFSPLRRAADAVTPRFLRGTAAVGAGVALGLPTAAARADDGVVMHRLPKRTTTTTSTTTLPPSAVVPNPMPAAPAPETWTVRPGDNFWRIAAANSNDTVPYWRLLIETNRPRLRDPRNPNLIYPGQLFALPSVQADGDLVGE
jgi:nucleoid-associated protein YgaU